MKVVGVLGGMSHVASAEYYRRLNAGINAARGGHASAEVVLYSVDFSVVEACIREQRWDDAAEHLVERALRVQRAGADVLLLATNTLHRVAPQLEAALDIPFLHIVDVTADAARAQGATRLGLLGTAPVMEADFYRDRFAAHGVEVLVPGEQDRALVHRVIFEELTHDVLREQSRQEYVRIIGDLVARGAEAVVLGCTEISLLVEPRHVPGTALLDTTALHVDRAVALALDGA